MARNDIKMLGVGGLWWHGQGRFTTDDGNLRLCFLGRTVEKTNGCRVGFIVDKTTSKSVLGYNPINERIITLRLKGNPMNITIIQVYAPTSDATDKDIEDFYEMVRETMDNVLRKDGTMVFGDGTPK